MLKLSNLETIGRPVYNFHNLHSVDFDGVDDFIQLSEPISYTQHTISTWVKITNSGSSKTIIDARDGNDDGIRLRTDASEKIIYELNTSDLTSTNSYVDEWVHVVATYDGTTQKLYINGALDQSATTSQEVSVTTNAEIGSRNFSDRAVEFLGKIDELAIFDRALEEEEVTKIYRIKYGANLVQNGNFDELGSELVTNGDYSDGLTGWSVSTSASSSQDVSLSVNASNQLVINSQGGSQSYGIAVQELATPTVAGNVYKVKIDILSVTGGQGANKIRVGTKSSEAAGSLSGGNIINDDSSFLGTGNVIYFTASSNHSHIAIGARNDITEMIVDNVSIKQVDPNDRFTLGTGFSFGDSKVIFSGTDYSSLTTTSNLLTSGKTYRVNLSATVTNGSFKLQNNGVDVITGSATNNYSAIFTSNSNTFNISRAGVGIQNDFTITNLMIEEQKYVATNLKLNSLPYSSSNLRNYYRFGDGILDKFPFINDMIAPSLANISTTNLVTHSEDLSQWGQSNVTRTSGFTAPDGTNTAYKLTTTSDNENAGVHIDVTTVSGTTYVMSGFFKNQNVTGKTSFMARVSGGTLFRRSISFDGAIATTSTYASTGTVDGIQLFEKDNGWYRFSFYFVADGTTTQVEVDVDRENEAVGNAIYFWGAMLEEGFQASEYIKTEGSTVSRTSTVENVYGSMINMTEADITNDVPS